MKGGGGGKDFCGCKGAYKNTRICGGKGAYKIQGFVVAKI